MFAGGTEEEALVEMLARVHCLRGLAGWTCRRVNAVREHGKPPFDFWEGWRLRPAVLRKVTLVYRVNEMLTV